MTKYKYSEDELLSVDNIKVYIAKDDLVKIDGEQGKKKKCLTLTKAVIETEYGIEAQSFDVTIDEMNNIQDEILYDN
jgi:hypothetical protein